MYTRGLVLTLSLLLGACGLNPQQSQTPAAEKAQHILPVRPDINAIGKQPPKQKPFVATPVKPQTKVVKPAPVKVSDLWQRIRQGYGLDHISNSRIDQQRRWYTRHPEYIQRVSKRAKPYLYHIVSELKRRQMPMELALLPIVESAFDPFAYSHGRASGLWQFTPPTARDFKLANTWWYDGRRDVEASTAAALDYLHQLNRRFDGDWLLALAAYNAGGGTVSKAIRKNKRRGRNTDFWSLSLPKETRAYVPRLLAMAEIVARPQAYRVSLHPILNQPYFKRFDLPYQLDLSQAAKLAQLPMDEIHLLNPGYSRWATDPSGAQHLLIPLSRAQQFRQNLDQLSPVRRVGWQRHEVKRGDTLSQIAEGYGIKVSDLRQVNKLRGNMIQPGQSLYIPGPSAQRLSQRQLKPQRQRSQAQYYRVKSGDTLWSISRRFGVDHLQLAQWNKLDPRATLKLGKRLRLYERRVKVAQADSGGLTKIHYRVRKGDSIAAIARRFGTSISAIVRANGLNPKQYLQPGQALTLLVHPQRG